MCQNHIYENKKNDAELDEKQEQTFQIAGFFIIPSSRSMHVVYYHKLQVFPFFIQWVHQEGIVLQPKKKCVIQFNA